MGGAAGYVIGGDDGSEVGAQFDNVAQVAVALQQPEYISPVSEPISNTGLTGNRFPTNPDEIPNLFPGRNMERTIQDDGKIIYKFSDDGKDFKIEFHPDHGGDDHFAGDHYHVKQLSSAPPPGRTSLQWFRVKNLDPFASAIPGGGTFGSGDLFPRQIR